MKIHHTNSRKITFITRSGCDIPDVSQNLFLSFCITLMSLGASLTTYLKRQPFWRVFFSTPQIKKSSLKQKQAFLSLKCGFYTCCHVSRRVRHENCTIDISNFSHYYQCRVEFKLFFFKAYHRTIVHIFQKEDLMKVKDSNSVLQSPRLGIQFVKC